MFITLRQLHFISTLKLQLTGEARCSVGTAGYISGKGTHISGSPNCVTDSLWVRRVLNTWGLEEQHSTTLLDDHLQSLSAYDKADRKVTNTFCSSIKRFQILQ